MKEMCAETKFQTTIYFLPRVTSVDIEIRRDNWEVSTQPSLL
jgi:hypothetical protein